MRWTEEQYEAFRQGQGKKTHPAPDPIPWPENIAGPDYPAAGVHRGRPAFYGGEVMGG